MKKFSVKHFHPNPRNNSEILGLTKKEAIEEARVFTSDEEGCSNIYKGDEGIAFRDWNKKCITWLK